MGSHYSQQPPGSPHRLALLLVLIVMDSGWGPASPAKQQRQVIILTDNRSPDSPGDLSRLSRTPRTHPRSAQGEATEWSLDEMKDRVRELEERVGRLEQELTSGEERRVGEGRKRRAFKEI